MGDRGAMVFSEVVGTLSFLQPQADDDIVDRLSYYYSSTALLLSAVLISIKMFGWSCTRSERASDDHCVCDLYF